MAVYQTDALVIRSREYGESDRLLTLFARESGKLQVVAKGVRKPTSRQRAGAQLFTYADFLLHRGRTLDTVNQASPRESFPHLWNDLDRTLAAAAIAELLDAATVREEPQPHLFTLTLTCFFMLAEVHPFLVQSLFALRLLEILGYSPRLGECAECGALIQGERVFFSPEAGGTVCSSCRGTLGGRTLSQGTLAFMRRLAQAEWAKVKCLRWPVWMEQEVRIALQHYCEEKFEHNLRSWRMSNEIGGEGINNQREG